MDIFNEEGLKRRVVLVMDKKEVKQLMSALKTAIKANKRKRIWRFMLKAFESKANVW